MTKKKMHQFERFALVQRAAHVMLLISFTLLGITGLPQKYPTTGWSDFIISAFGGIELTREIHHVSAFVLMVLTIYHIIDVGYKIFVRRVPMSMLPGIKDAKDAWQALMYNLGRAKNRPQMGRYTFEEKLEYWALVWGTVIMGSTGFMMWNPITTARFLPGEFIPAAKAAHGGEALLAILAIIVWHMYAVHIKTFNKSMFTGKLTEEEMLHEHPLELADIKAGIAERPVDPKTLRKRQLVYWPMATLLAGALLFGAYGFAFAETSAITTVPPRISEVPAYLPLTPTPAPTPESTEVVLTWNGTIGSLFQTRCAACHGAAALGGLNLTTYQQTLAGGTSGPAIIPGDPGASLLISRQELGDHPGQFTADELDIVRQWIENGAPDN
ncbi:MAG: cytochrome b/b6 domain-containing protein [Chloroflexota bacterium]